MAKANPEGMKWPTDKAKYDENYLKIFASVKTAGGEAMIRKCNCRSVYQDTKYGVGMRVHNKAKSRVQGKVAWTCTVCGVKKD